MGIRLFFSLIPEAIALIAIISLLFYKLDDKQVTEIGGHLAAEGIKFTRVFSCAGVCAPSRFALITGMYPSAAGANNLRTESNSVKISGSYTGHPLISPALMKLRRKRLELNIVKVMRFLYLNKRMNSEVNDEFWKIYAKTGKITIRL